MATGYEEASTPISTTPVQTHETKRYRVLRKGESLPNRGRGRGGHRHYRVHQPKPEVKINEIISCMQQKNLMDQQAQYTTNYLIQALFRKVESLERKCGLYKKDIKDLQESLVEDRIKIAALVDEVDALKRGNPKTPPNSPNQAPSEHIYGTFYEGSEADTAEIEVETSK